MPSVTENLGKIRAKVADACQKAGRSPDDLQIVAVTKTRSPEEIREAAAAGLKLFAESRIQEAKSKLPALKSLGEWHFIGHLQTNKARQSCELFDLVESVDSLHLAQSLSEAAQKAARLLPVFAEINVSGEEQKHGLPLEQAYDQVLQISQRPGLRLIGLMTMAPLVGNPEQARPVFAGLRGLARKLEPALGRLSLSMGMSNDYAVAVEEGATHLRIGRALFEG